MRYLTVILGESACAIELASVREWLGYMPHAPMLANNDPAVLGWFDYRGRRARVIDLRARFGLPIIRTQLTSMITVEHFDECYALIVDHVTGIAPPGEMPMRILDLNACISPPRPLPKAA